MLSSLPGGATAVLAAAVEALPFGVAITDHRGTITWASAAFAQLSSGTRDELLGQSAGEFDWEALSHEDPSSEPWRGVYVRETGEASTLEHSITALRNPVGELAGFWITKRDATELKRPAGMPYLAEANLSAVIESTDDLIGSVDLEYRLVTFNKALQDNIKWNVGLQAAVGMRLEDWLPSERLALWPPMFERALSEGPFRTEYNLLDGRTLELSFSPIRQNDRAVGISIFGKEITARKTAENTLREAEAKYRNIFDGALEGIFRTSLEGKALTANHALAKMLGYDSPEEGVPAVTDVALQVWLDPSERSRFLKLLRDQGFVLGCECQLKRKDGVALWASVKARIVQPVDGAAPYIEGFVEDITERKRMQDALRKSEQKFTELFLCNPAVTILFTPEVQGNQIADVNEAFEQSTGFRREEVIGLTTKELGLWADPSDFDDFMNRFRASGRVRNFEHRVCKKNGEIGIGLTSAEIVELDDVPFAVSATIDITEKKEAEAALYESERRLREMLENTHLLTAMLDEAGNITFCNDFLLRLTGWRRDELMGRDWCSLLVPSGQYSRDLFSKQVSEKTIPIHHENEIITKAGERRTISWNNTVLFDAAGKPIGVATIGEDITEPKRMEVALRKSAETLATVFRSSPNATMIFKLVDNEYRIADVNEAFEQRTGYRRDEVVGQTIDELGLWADLNEGIEYMKRFRANGRVINFEHGFRTKKGDIGVCLSSAESIEIDGVPCAIAATIDITEQKKSELALKQANEAVAKAERHYRRLFNSVSDAVIVCKLEQDGLSSHIYDVNDNASHFLGYTREELLQLQIGDIDAPENRPNAPAIADRLFTEGHLIKEQSVIAKDGRRLPVEINTHVFDLDGSPTMISCMRDISERKKNEESMRTLATAIEQATDTIVITALDGTIQYCNPAFEKITGYSKEEAIGQNPSLLKSGKHSKVFYEQMWGTVKQGNVWSGHITNKKKDGSLYEESATISPIRDSTGKISGFVAVKRDVTERRQLEDQLRQAQKLESVGKLAGGVAHDFNNLLTVINGYSGFLLKALKAGDPARGYAEEIKTAGERAAALTKQLLAFSRKQVIEPKVVDLNAIIRESAAMLRRLIGDDIALETHMDGSLGRVMADPDQLHQVIMNLAVNARDAMPDGGSLEIETLNVEIGEERAAGQRETNPGRYVVLSVRDTGHGMDEAVRKHIFEPFFTTKGVGQGTGLGLSTVYGITRQNGGWIDVWSEVGVGTKFKLYLPRIDACAVEEEEESVAVGGGGETILVVEDQEAVRSFAKAALRQHGYQVIHAGDGDQALSVAKLHSGQIDLLLTDVVMPGLNGRELSERLKEVRPNVKVLFVSGYTADVIAQRGVLDPGVAFLHKPFGQEELAQKVREVLDRGV